MKLRKPRAASPVKTMLARMTGKGRKQENTYVKLRKPRAASPVKTMLARMTGKGCSATNLPHLQKTSKKSNELKKYEFAYNRLLPTLNH